MELQPIFTVAYAISGLIFFIFEAWAIKNKTSGDTLSEHIRHYFQVKGKVGSFAFLAIFGAFAAWFAAHIVQVPV